MLKIGVLVLCSGIGDLQWAGSEDVHLFKMRALGLNSSKYTFRFILR